jgi:hypothetical protein
MLIKHPLSLCCAGRLDGKLEFLEVEFDGRAFSTLGLLKLLLLFCLMAMMIDKGLNGFLYFVDSSSTDDIVRPTV